jgi:signal transduction histidine kinase
MYTDPKGLINHKIPNPINDSSTWDKLIHPRPVVLILLICLGILIQVDIHIDTNISAAYTQFFFIIIVLAGLWYQRKAIWIALFFGTLYLSLELIPPSFITLDSIFRVLMFCIVAIIVGCMTERMEQLRHVLHDSNTKLVQSHNALKLGNKKLHMLSSITRHDILNQVHILLLFLDLSKEVERNPTILEYIEKEEQAAKTIESHITFTKYYQNIGVHEPAWQNVEDLIKISIGELPVTNIQMTISLSGLEVYADQLIQKVFYNLIENSLRHGGAVTDIRFLFFEADNEGVIIYQDNGVGISPENRAHLFERGYGKHTGLGLFLSREILSITGITIIETGEENKGVRFEIHIPTGKFQISEKNENREA